MEEKDRNPDGTLRPGHRVTTKHGGEAAVKAIQRGEPLTGLAAIEERQVKADLEDLGRAELVKEMAIRLHVAARLYWNAIATVADRVSADKQQVALLQLDKYVARFGWLAGATIRAWREVRVEEPDDSGVIDYEKLVAAQRALEDNEDG